MGGASPRSSDGGPRPSQRDHHGRDGDPEWQQIGVLGGGHGLTEEEDAEGDDGDAHQLGLEVIEVTHGEPVGHMASQSGKGTSGSRNNM